jgi:hypothetical protein
MSPLRKGYSRKTVSENISTEAAHGKSRKQAVAISLDTARKSALRRLGYVPDSLKRKKGK